MASDLKTYRAMCRRWSQARGTDPDAFVRYELPYDVDDPETIEAALVEKYRLWQMDRRKTAVFVRFLEQHDEMRSKLADPVERRQLAEVCRREEEAFRQRNAAKIEEHLERIHSRQKYVSETEFANLARLMGHLGLEEEEFRQRLRIPIRPDVAEPGRAEAGLHQALMEEIDQALRMFERESLYEFLELAEDAPQSEVEDRARELAERWDARPRDERNTFAQKLLGIIDTYLVAEGGERRPSYDEALREYRLGKVIGVDLRLFAASGLITYDEFRKLIQLSTANGFDPEEAKAFVIKRARQLDAQIEISPDPGGRTCPRCGVFNRPTAGFCVHCHQQLLRECPFCNSPQSALETDCEACGESLELSPEDARKAAEVRELIAGGDLETAATTITDFRERMPGSKTVQGLEQQLAAERQQCDEQLREIDALVERGNLALARARRQEIEARFGHGGTGVGSDFAARLAAHDDRRQAVERELEFELRRAHRLQQADDLPAALAVYEELKVRWPDNDQIGDALANCPVASPAGKLEAWSLGLMVELRWDERNGAVRIEREVLTGPRAGSREILPDSDEPSFRDPEVEPGEAVRYHLRRRQRGQSSEEAIASDPVLVWEPLSEVAATSTGDGEITITWQGAGGAAAIEALRTDASVPLRAQAPPLIDRGLTNDRTYEYVLQALYRDPSNRLEAVTNATVEATPKAPPPPPGRIELRHQRAAAGGGAVTVTLSTEAPERGGIRFYRAPTEPTWELGTRLAAADLEPYGPPLPAHPAAGAADRVTAIDRNPPPGVSYYLPVTAGGPYLVAGKPRSGIHTEPIANLHRAKDTPDHLVKLRWDWPRGCSHVLVLWRSDAPPEAPDDDRADRREITEAHYLLNEGFDLPRQRCDRVHVRLFDGVTYTTGGQSKRFTIPKKKPSPGSQITLDLRGQPTLSYKVEVNRGYSVTSHLSSARLIIKIQPPSGEVPKLVLLSDPQRKPLPTDVGDQQMLVMEIEPKPDEKEEITRWIDQEHLARDQRFALYFKDPTHYSTWKIQSLRYQ